MVVYQVTSGHHTEGSNFALHEYAILLPKSVGLDAYISRTRISKRNKDVSLQRNLSKIAFFTSTVCFYYKPGKLQDIENIDNE